MNEKLMVVLVFVILGMVVLTYGYTQQGQYTKQNNTVQNATTNGTVQDNKTNVDGARYNDVMITQKGPRTPQKRGTSVPIYYTITNNGKNKVYGVEVWSQDFGKDIGTLDPGQPKNIHI